MAFDQFAVQLKKILPLFALDEYSAEILEAYQIISEGCSQLPCAAASPRSSSLNHDGNPIQLSLALGLDAVPFHFLADPRGFSVSGEEHVKAIRHTITALATLLRAEKQLALISDLIDTITQVNPLDLTPDHGGTFWIGAGFSSDWKAALKIYMNGKRGREIERWDRCETFIAHFGASQHWRDLRKLLANEVKPLGMSITLAPDSLPTGRVYLSGYGILASHYKTLLEYSEGKKVTETFSKFAACVLGEDRDYPTQSAVFSIAAVNGQLADAKLELCAHCLFSSDAQAFDICSQWLNSRKIDPQPYHSLLYALSEPRNRNTVDRHVYLGLGWKQQCEYTSIYLKPDLG
jgi:hypothetical protein